MKEITFTVTENTESINGLKTIKFLMRNLEKDLYTWKWIVIATHNCVQNFMSSALRSTNNLNILDKNSSKLWYDEFLNRMNNKVEDWNWPEEKLDYFLNLFKKVKSDKMLFLVTSKKFESDQDTDEAMSWLNWHRNFFIHFIPSTFTFNVIDFPKRLLLVSNLIKFIIFESGNILWLNIEEKESAEKLILELIEDFEHLNKKY